MGKIILLGVLVAVVLGIAIMPYMKWLLLLLVFKVIIELIIKFRASSSGKFKIGNPVKGARMCVAKAGSRIEQGFETPKVPLGKVMFLVLGVFVILVAGKGLLDMLIGFFDEFKYILIVIVLLLALVLISKAKNGRPITLRKVARRINRKPSMSRYEDDCNYNRYEEEYYDEYEHSRKPREKYYGEPREKYYGKPRDEHYSEPREEQYDDICLRCRHSRTCDEQRRRNCSELNGRYNREDSRQSRSRRMEYM